MLIPGLVSVTFRKLNVNQIAELMVKSKLTAIEWGGDVHIPEKEDDSNCDELDDALTKVAQFSEDGKFYIASYGSYCRCENRNCNRTVEIARSINALNIRVWAGTRSSSDADDFYRGVVTENIRNICDLAKPYGITVSTEFHGGTLTDHYESAIRLINDVERENFFTYWQPNQFRDYEYNIASLRAVMPYLSNVHVFTWRGHDKFPLDYGENEWKSYIDIIKSSGGTHHMLLEFVCDDTVEQFYRDAETLRSWIDE